MTTGALTELNAVILLALAKATAEDPERYLTRKESRMDHEFAERSLNQLERAGLVEQNKQWAAKQVAPCQDEHGPPYAPEVTCQRCLALAPRPLPKARPRP